MNEYLLITWDNLHVADMDVMVHTAFTGTTHMTYMYTRIYTYSKIIMC